MFVLKIKYRLSLTDMDNQELINLTDLKNFEEGFDIKKNLDRKDTVFPFDVEDLKIDDYHKLFPSNLFKLKL